MLGDGGAQHAAKVVGGHFGDGRELDDALSDDRLSDAHGATEQVDHTMMIGSGGRLATHTVVSVTVVTVTRR
jgi:hypothetical protein